jgi:energy-converting hydrogenase Eha subunit A
MPATTTLTARWVLTHVVVAAALYRVDTYYLAQGFVSGLVTTIMVALGLVSIGRGLFGDRARLARGAVLVGLYSAMMFLVVWTLHASNHEARTRATRVIAALHGYREARGAYPEHLADLVPAFLPSVPRAKDISTFGDFSYVWSEKDGGFLMYTEIPPFGRPYYDLRNEVWKYMD